MSVLESCIRAAIAGAHAVRAATARPSSIKKDAFVGHHAVVGPADLKSQEAILRQIRLRFPTAWCMTEEPFTRQQSTLRRVTPASLARAMQDRLFVIDELDGSSAYAVGHYEWSTSVACVEMMEHTAGAVCAPDIWNGVLFFADNQRNGVAALNTRLARSLRVASATLRNSYLLIGPDLLIKQFSPLLPGALELANAARTANVANSCALGMALVAAGRAHLLIEPPQRAWDWGAGRRLVESAGGVVIFFRLLDGRIARADRPTLADYDPRARTLGFVAGVERLAEHAFRVLEKGCVRRPQNTTNVSVGA